MGSAGAVMGPNAQAFDSLTAMLDAVEVDVVAVATPNGSHVDLACQAIEAGCHVIVEKPMGLTVDSVARLQATAPSEAVGFGVMQNRFAPAAQWLKRRTRLDSLARCSKCMSSASGTVMGAITFLVLGVERFPKMEARCSPSFPISWTS